jgi:hypothetical protein
MSEMFVNFVPTKFDIDISKFLFTCLSRKGHPCHDRMVVGFTTTCAISAYHN